MTAPEANLRAADSDRERAVQLLRRHHDAGRLDHDDLEERVQAAYRSRTYGDLNALFLDLPALPGPPAAPTTSPVLREVSAPVRLGGGSSFRVTGVVGVPVEDAARELVDELAHTVQSSSFVLVDTHPRRLVLAGRRVPYWSWPLALFTFPFGLLAFLARTEERVTIELEPTADGLTRFTAYGIAPRRLRKHLGILAR